MEPNVPICQSCGMPMEKSEDFGTSVDRGKYKDYCRFCFQKRKLTDSDITIEQMIDKAISF
jgi:hypothetical protein